MSSLFVGVQPAAISGQQDKERLEEMARRNHRLRHLDQLFVLVPSRLLEPPHGLLLADLQAVHQDPLGLLDQLPRLKGLVEGADLVLKELDPGILRGIRSQQ